MSSVVLRPYRRGDDIEINNAFNEIFGAQRSVEEWQWKFLPFDNGSRILLAVDRSENDKIVAQYSVATTLAQINGAVITLGQPVDVFSYRKPHLVHGQVFVKLIQALFARYGNPRHCNVLYGFPGKRAYRLGRAVGLYPLMLPVPYFSASISRPHGKRHSTQYHCSKELKAHDCDELWSRACSRYPVSVIRTFAYLQRRFLSRPHSHYQYAACYQGATLTAWAVFQIKAEVCEIIDLLWDGVDSKCITQLQTAVFQRSSAQGCTKAEMWLANDPNAVTALCMNGWQQSLQPQELVMGANSYDPTIDAVEFMSRLYFTMADSDLY